MLVIYRPSEVAFRIMVIMSAGIPSRSANDRMPLMVREDVNRVRHESFRLVRSPSGSSAKSSSSFSFEEESPKMSLVNSLDEGSWSVESASSHFLVRLLDRIGLAKPR